MAYKQASWLKHADITETKRCWPTGAANTSNGQIPLKTKRETRNWWPKQPTAEKPEFQPVSLGWPALAQGSLVGGKCTFLVTEDLSQLSDAPDRQRLGSVGSRVWTSMLHANCTHTQPYQTLQGASGSSLFSSRNCLLGSKVWPTSHLSAVLGVLCKNSNQTASSNSSNQSVHFQLPEGTVEGMLCKNCQ